MLDVLPLDPITDPQARVVIQRLLNLIETLSSEQEQLKTENQQLRDENNRLKGTPTARRFCWANLPPRMAHRKRSAAWPAGAYVNPRTTRSVATAGSPARSTRPSRHRMRSPMAP